MNAKIKDILIQNLCSEWKTFAYGTGLNSVIIEYIDRKKGSIEFKLETFLLELTEQNPTNVITLVEKSLLEIGYINVLKEVQIYNAMERLKLHYLTLYSNFNQSSQFKPTNDKDNITNHIELVRVDCMDYKDTHFKDSFNEWENFIKKNNDLKTLTFEEVFASEHLLTLMSGIVGIGKTYFLKKCLYLWSNGLIWKNVDFVFYFDLKKLGEFQNISNVSELLRKFYRNILKDVEISSKWSITFLIDGLDQFKFFDKLIYHKLGRLNDIPIVNMLEKVFSSRDTKCILAGRVQAVAAYYNACKEEETKSFLNIQIRGFSNLGMDYYIENNILVSNLKEDLCKILSTSFEGKSLLSVPLYLKAICSTLLNLMHVSVKTVSELQTLVFYYFIKRNSESINEPIVQLIQNKKEEILKACKVAFILLEKGRVFVSQEEFYYIEHGMNPLGFVEMCNITQQYVFTHFIMLKFCASVHLYLCESPKVALNNNRLHLCLPIVIGLGYSKERNFLNVISNMKTVQSEKSWLQEILDFNNRKLFIDCFYESQTSLNNDINLSTDKLKELSDALSGDVKDIAEKYFIAKSGDSHKNSLQLELNHMKICFEKIKEDIKEAIRLTAIVSSVSFASYGYCIMDIGIIEKFLNNILEKNQIHENFREESDIRNNKYSITNYTMFNGQLYKKGKIMYDDQFYNVEKLLLGAQINQTDVSIEKKKNHNVAIIEEENNDSVVIIKEKNVGRTIRRIIDSNINDSKINKVPIETLFSIVSIETKTKYSNAISLYHKKHFDDAENMLKDVEIIQNNELGCKHSDTLNTRFWIARCLFDKDQIDNAEVLFTEVKNKQIEVLGEDHVNTLDTKYWIGRCLMDKDEFDKAEKLLLVVDNIQKESLGRSHFKTLDTKFRIAMCLFEKNDFDNAEILLTKVENIQKEVLGINHVDTLTAKYWIARCLWKKKNINFAEKKFREVKNKQIEVLGEGHVNTLNTKYWIGRCLYDKDDFDDAEILLTEVENIQKKVLGINHVDTLTTKYWIARCLWENNNINFAEKKFREVKNKQIEVLGEGHDNTLDTKYWIGRCLYDKDEFNKAEILLTEVVNKQIEVLGEGHVNTLDTKYWIGRCLYDKDEFDNAEILLTEVSNKQIVSFGEYHADTLETKHWVGRCFYDNEQYEYAERIFREVKNKRIETLGEYHVDTLETKFWIGRCLYETEQYDYAERIFREVKNKQRETLGEDHVNTLDTKFWIGRCLFNKKQFDYAERIFREVKNKQRETLGEDHVNTLDTKFWIELSSISFQIKNLR